MLTAKTYKHANIFTKIEDNYDQKKAFHIALSHWSNIENESNDTKKMEEIGKERCFKISKLF